MFISFIMVLKIIVSRPKRERWPILPSAAWRRSSRLGSRSRDSKSCGQSERHPVAAPAGKHDERTSGGRGAGGPRGDPRPRPQAHHGVPRGTHHSPFLHRWGYVQGAAPGTGWYFAEDDAGAIRHQCPDHHYFSKLSVCWCSLSAQSTTGSIQYNLVLFPTKIW